MKRPDNFDALLQTYPEQFEAFSTTCDDLARQHVIKSSAYGAHAIGRFGVFGIAVRMSDKIERLITLTMNPNISDADESIDDTLRDLAGYAIIALIVRQGKWGK
jgi:hypothetical protein